MGTKLILLTAPAAVIDALGGNGPVAELTGCKDSKTVSAWRTFQTLPSKTFVVMFLALTAKGYTARPSLWGMVEVPRVLRVPGVDKRMRAFAEALAA